MHTALYCTIIMMSFISQALLRLNQCSFTFCQYQRRSTQTFLICINNFLNTIYQQQQFLPYLVLWIMLSVGQILVYIFLFARTNRNVHIHIGVCLFLSTQIYLYLYSLFMVNPYKVKFQFG